MKRTLRKLLAGSVIAAASILPMKKAEAQFNGGSVEYVHSGKSENSYGRLLGFYGLPAEISGFSFVELYKNGDGYFGETYLDKSLVGRLGLRLEADHIGEPLSQVGLGVSTTIPGLPSGSFARINLLPFWIGHEGDLFGDKAQAQYVFGFSLPKGLNLGGFGEWNLLKKGGPQWGYGEIEATVDIGKALSVKGLEGIRVGYNPALLPDGDAVPSVRQRGIAKFTF